MTRNPTLGRRAVVLVAALGLAAVAGPALAWHYHDQGWRDQHRQYPPRPHGYSQIVSTFGQPCNDNANRNGFQWRAADNGVWYTVRFHRKLGGDASTNLDNDVRGHILNKHLSPYIRHGIYGYACRSIRGSGAWSTHS